MRVFRSVRGFLRVVCKETGRIYDARQGWYVWTDSAGEFTVRDYPPQYAPGRRVCFFADEHRFVVRRYGVWVEGTLTPAEKQLLRRRQLRLAMDRLWAKPSRVGHFCVPYSVEQDVRSLVAQYLENARRRISATLNNMVFQEAIKEMENSGLLDVADEDEDQLFHQVR